MKRLILAVGTVALGVAAWQVGQARERTTAQTQIATFRIVVEPSANGLKATCVSGCAWKELTFGCELPLKQSCKAEIDQAGISGAR